MQKIYVPRTIRQFQNNAELSVDVMFVNNVPFLISEHIHYSTVNAVDHLKYNALETQVKGVLRSYAVRCFRIIVIGVDVQFKALKGRNNCDMPFNVASR